MNYARTLEDEFRRARELDKSSRVVIPLPSN